MGTEDICGQLYRVVEATPEDCPQLAEAEGYTDCTNNTIYLLASLPETRKTERRVHERIHAFFEASGVDHILRAKCKTDSEAEFFEETLIRVASPWLALMAKGYSRKKRAQ